MIIGALCALVLVEQDDLSPGAIVRAPAGEIHQLRRFPAVSEAIAGGTGAAAHRRNRSRQGRHLTRKPRQPNT